MVYHCVHYINKLSDDPILNYDRAITPIAILNGSMNTQYTLMCSFIYNIIALNFPVRRILLTGAWLLTRQLHYHHCLIIDDNNYYDYTIMIFTVTHTISRTIIIVAIAINFVTYCTSNHTDLHHVGQWVQLLLGQRLKRHHCYLSINSLHYLQVQHCRSSKSTLYIDHYICFAPFFHIQNASRESDRTMQKLIYALIRLWK